VCLAQGLSCGSAERVDRTETLIAVSPSSKEAEPQPSAEELDAARELLRQARARGVVLTGPDGLLKALTKAVLETALEEKMSEHLGYNKHEVAGRNLANSGNGRRLKTVLTRRPHAGRRRPLKMKTLDGSERASGAVGERG
jgi:hypothetical protein